MKSITIPTAVLVRELPGGGHEATSIAAFELVSYGSEVGAVDQHRRYLESLLLQTRAPVIARFETPPVLELHDIKATVTRLELPRHLRKRIEIEIPCVIASDRKGHWALVCGLRQAIWANASEDREAVFREELERLLGAADTRELDIRRLLPADDTWIEPVEVELLVGDEGISGRAAALRKRRIAEHRRKLALETLTGAGVELLARPPHARPELHGRDRELAALSALIDGDARTSVAVVGAESAGKSELIAAYVDRSTGARRPIYATSVAQLVAGASGFGEWQERVHKVLDAAEAIDAILYFDNLGELFGEHPEAGGVDVAGLLRRYVVNERVRVLGELSPAALERARRRQVALLSATATVRIEPLDPDQTARAVAARIALWDEAHRRDPSQPPVDPRRRSTAGRPRRALPAVPRQPRQVDQPARGAAGDPSAHPRRRRPISADPHRRLLRGVRPRHPDPGVSRPRGSAARGRLARASVPATDDRTGARDPRCRRDHLHRQGAPGPD